MVELVRLPATSLHYQCAIPLWSALGLWHILIFLIIILTILSRCWSTHYIIILIQIWWSSVPVIVIRIISIIVWGLTWITIVINLTAVISRFRWWWVIKIFLTTRRSFTINTRPISQDWFIFLTIPRSTNNHHAGRTTSIILVFITSMCCPGTVRLLR